MTKFIRSGVIVLLIVILLVFIFQLLSPVEIIKGEAPAISPQPSGFEMEADIYYINGNALLESEKRLINVEGNDVVKAVFEEMKQRPQEDAHFNVIDQDVTILSSEIVNQKLYLNLSEQLLNSAFWQRGYRDVIIYSIVNSLTQFDTIDRMQIKVNDVDISAYAMDGASKGDLSFNRSIIEIKADTPEEVVVSFLQLITIKRYSDAYRMTLAAQEDMPEAFESEMKRYTKLKENYELGQPFSVENDGYIDVYVNYKYYDEQRHITYETSPEIWRLLEISPQNYKIEWPRQP